MRELTAPSLPTSCRPSARRRPAWSAVRLAVVAVAVALVATLTPASASAVPHSGSFGRAIDAYARYEGQSRCAPVEQPGVVEFRALLQRHYGANGGGIVRGCHVGGRSEHKEGRAYDWMLNASNAADRRKAEAVLSWLLATDEHGNRHAMARRLGIMYIIWDRQQWSAYRPDAGWQPYRGASPHTDHIHFSFSWAGARRQTSFWSPAARVSTGGGVFVDVPRRSHFHTPVSWLVANDISGGLGDGTFGTSAPVTRAQMAALLWRAAGSPAPAGRHPFTDVPSGAFYTDAVSWLHETGIVTGRSTARFDPAAPVTRGQMASLLWRWTGSPPASARHRFGDVQRGEHFDVAVSYLAGHGIVSGVGQGRYVPTAATTRGQTAVLLWRLAGTEAAWQHTDRPLPTARF